MARKSGIQFLSTLSHDMTRGNREKPIIKNDQEQKQYLNKLKNQEEKYKYNLRAMSSNHSYLTIETAACHY